jgi:hypothetical protein
VFTEKTSVAAYGCCSCFPDSTIFGFRDSPYLVVPIVRFASSPEVGHTSGSEYERHQEIRNFVFLVGIPSKSRGIHSMVFHFPPSLGGFLFVIPWVKYICFGKFAQLSYHFSRLLMIRNFRPVLFCPEDSAVALLLGVMRCFYILSQAGFFFSEAYRSARGDSIPDIGVGNANMRRFSFRISDGSSNKTARQVGQGDSPDTPDDKAGRQIAARTERLSAGEELCFLRRVWAFHLW